MANTYSVLPKFLENLSSHLVFEFKGKIKFIAVTQLASKETFKWKRGLVIAVKAYQTFPLLNIDVFHLSACPPAHMSPYSLPILPSVTCLPAFMFNTYRRTFHLFSFLSAFLPTSPLTHQDSHIYTFPTFRKPTCSFSHLIICPPALMLT